MFDDIIQMIPRAFGYTMAKSFYTYIDKNKVKDNKDNKDKNVSKDSFEKDTDIKIKDKKINLLLTKGF